MRTIQIIKHSASRIFDSSLGLLAAIGGLILLFVTVIVATDVTLRFFWHKTIDWVPDIARYALLFITFLGGGWVLKNNKHVIIDVLVTRLQPKAQASLNLTTALIGALSCLIITFFGAWVTLDAYKAGYLMAAGLMPPQYLILFIIPIGTLLMTIQFLRISYNLLKSPKRKSLTTEVRDTN